MCFSKKRQHFYILLDFEGAEGLPGSSEELPKNSTKALLSRKDAVKRMSSRRQHGVMSSFRHHFKKRQKNSKGY